MDGFGSMTLDFLDKLTVILPYFLLCLCLAFFHNYIPAAVFSVFPFKSLFPVIPLSIIPRHLTKVLLSFLVTAVTPGCDLTSDSLELGTSYEREHAMSVLLGLGHSIQNHPF